MRIVCIKIKLFNFFARQGLRELSEKEQTEPPKEPATQQGKTALTRFKAI